MKNILKPFMFLIVFLMFTYCSEESLNSAIENENLLEIDTPMENGPVEIAGFPKMLKKYEDGILTYWAQYYYRLDGNILKVDYGYSSSSSEIFSDIFLYNSEGKLIKLNGHDIYNFYWEGGRIVRADRYNGMWYGRFEIFYEYNNLGQLINKQQNNIDFNFQEKTFYTYSEEGNLKSIEEYGDYNKSGVFTLYVQTNFESYGMDLNLFPEVQIIPGLSAQNRFPSSMGVKYFPETGNNTYDTFNYEYDTNGKVIKKTYGNNTIVYDYY